MKRTALVTGAGSGIGRVTALALLREGYAVALAGRSADKLEETRMLAGEGASTLVVPTDVTQPEAVDALFTGIKDQFGRLDVLFNNAGIFVPGVPFDELTAEQWNASVAVNL